MKCCNKCNISKEYSNFSKNKRYVDTLEKFCKECRKINYQTKEKEKLSLYYKNRFKKEKEQILERNRTWYRNNKEKRAISIKEWSKQHKDKKYSYCKKWTKNNRRKCTAYQVKREADKILRTPTWVNLEEIEKIYNACPKGLEVDHIVPLRGKNVSGLHVSWNLQYLTKSENCSKGNRF